MFTKYNIFSIYYENAVLIDEWDYSLIIFKPFTSFYIWTSIFRAARVDFKFRWMNFYETTLTNPSVWTQRTAENSDFVISFEQSRLAHFLTLRELYKVYSLQHYFGIVDSHNADSRARS